MPYPVPGNTRTALIDSFDKPESAHLVGNFYQWIYASPGSLGVLPSTTAGIATSSVQLVNASGGFVVSNRIFDANQKLSVNLVQRANNNHEEFNMYIKYNLLGSNYYQCTWYTSDATYHVQKVVNGSSTSLNSFPGWSPAVGQKLSLQWLNGVLGVLVNDSAIATFNDTSITNPGRLGFGFFLEQSSNTGTTQIDNATVEIPGAFGAGIGQPIPPLGWDL